MCVCVCVCVDIFIKISCLLTEFCAPAVLFLHSMSQDDFLNENKVLHCISMFVRKAEEVESEHRMHSQVQRNH